MHQIQLTTISSKRPNSKVLNLSNINQINLWIQSSIEKVSKQASTQLIIQPIEKLVTDQLIHQSVRPSVAINKSVSQIDSESVSQSVNQSVAKSFRFSQWGSRSFGESGNQLISQLVSFSQPVHQSVLTHSINQTAQSHIIDHRQRNLDALSCTARTLKPYLTILSKCFELCEGFCIDIPVDWRSYVFTVTALFYFR